MKKIQIDAIAEFERKYYNIRTRTRPKSSIPIYIGCFYPYDAFLRIIRDDLKARLV
jgi:hypothetical protein